MDWFDISVMSVFLWYSIMRKHYAHYVGSCVSNYTGIQPFKNWLKIKIIYFVFSIPYEIPERI